MQDKSYRRNVGTWKQVKKNTRTKRETSFPIYVAFNYEKQFILIITLL